MDFADCVLQKEYVQYQWWKQAFVRLDIAVCIPWCLGFHVAFVVAIEVWKMKNTMQYIGTIIIDTEIGSWIEWDLMVDKSRHRKW